MRDTPTSKKRLLPLAAGILIAAVLIIASNSRTTGAIEVICGPHWANSIDLKVREVCGKEKRQRTLEQEQQEAKAREAKPYYQTVPGFQPSVMLPQPDDTKLIQEVQLENPIADQQQGRPATLRGANSMWQAGSVPNADYTMWDPLMIVTYGGNGAQWYVPGLKDAVTRWENPTLQTLGLGWDEDQGAKYSFTWTCPEPVGEIYITKIEAGRTAGIGADGANFAGLNYKVYFDTKTGVSGYFDMVTQQWTFLR